jgi:hypothetical protein
MKHKIVIAVLAITLFSCTKQASKELAPVKVNYEQLAKVIGAGNAFIAFDNAGLTEDNPVARGRKAKNDATLNAWFNALTLIQLGPTTFQFTTPINPRYSAFQNFQATRTVSPYYCNYWLDNAGPPQTYTCNDTLLTNGDIRAFTQDQNFDIWVTNVIPN